MKKFISNDDLVQKFFVGAGEEKHVLRHLLVIVSLVKTYGHKLDISDGYLKIIGEKYPEITRLYTVLRTLGKTNSKDLNAIVKLCKKEYVQYRKEFTITSPGSATGKALDEFIHTNFSGADLAFIESSTLGIDIKGEGYRYHRNLDKDLETLLR